MFVKNLVLLLTVLFFNKHHTCKAAGVQVKPKDPESVTGPSSWLALPDSSQLKFGVRAGRDFALLLRNAFATAEWRAVMSEQLRVCQEQDQQQQQQAAPGSSSSGTSVRLTQCLREDWYLVVRSVVQQVLESGRFSKQVESNLFWDNELNAQYVALDTLTLTQAADASVSTGSADYLATQASTDELVSTVFVVWMRVAAKEDEQDDEEDRDRRVMPCLPGDCKMELIADESDEENEERKLVMSCMAVGDVLVMPGPPATVKVQSLISASDAREQCQLSFIHYSFAFTDFAVFRPNHTRIRRANEDSDEHKLIDEESFKHDL